jgi:SLOG cluster3 family
MRLCGTNLLHGTPIFLAASKPNRELDTYQLMIREIDEAVLSLCRAVFSEGGRLIYGGHPSISPLIATVAAEYFRPQPGNPLPPVLIYQSEAYANVIPQTTRLLEEMGYARIHWIERFGTDEYVAGGPHCPNSLEKMRVAMLQNPLVVPVAMVSIGGMGGVLNEARMFLGVNPGQIYILRTTAGATAYLVTRLVAERPEWGRRLNVLEDLFEYGPPPHDPDRGSERYLAPYPLLMQRMVRRIAEGLSDQ